MKTHENKAQIIGSRIKEARELAKCSQLTLAKELGFSSGTAISLIESGERDITVENLEKVAAFFHLDIKYFLGSGDIEEPSVEVALRADPNLSDESRKAILQFIEFSKTRKNER